MHFQKFRFRKFISDIVIYAHVFRLQHSSTRGNMERAGAGVCHNLSVNINTQEEELFTLDLRQTNQRDIKQFTNHMCNTFKYLKRLARKLHAEFSNLLQTINTIIHVTLIPFVPALKCLQFSNLPVSFFKFIEAPNHKKNLR